MSRARLGGHGHVTPRIDGIKLRCGGPGPCPNCSQELADKIHQEAFQFAAEKLAALPIDGPRSGVYGERERQRQAKWDRRHLALAAQVATWSKDPSTKVGALITTADNRPISWGYNGFPIGVDDAPERYADRELKYQLIVHGEVNALANARRDVSGCTLYTWPFAPCVRCAGVVIQHGIRRVVAPRTPPELKERWAKELALAELLFKEAGVALVLRDPEGDPAPEAAALEVSG